MKVALITLSVLLLTILLISDSEERRVGRAMQGKSFLRRYGPAIRTGLVVGKRSVGDNPCPGDPMDQAKAQQLLTQLKLSCPEFAIRPQVGLPKAVVLDAFEAVDEDNNDSLSDKELDNLENVLEAYEVCEEEAAKQL